MTGRRRSVRLATRLATRLAAAVALTVLAAGAGAALWRSAHAPADRVGRIAAGLRCPACDGESVAQSRSAVAAAMRAAVADQVAHGRSDAQIRAWFVDRYGTDVLAGPRGGATVLLWVLPVLALAAAVVLAVRASRRVRRPVPPSGAGPPRGTRVVWDVVAVALVAMVAVVAAAARTTRPEPAAARPVAAPSPADPVRARLDLAAALERRGEYAAAADVYRDLADRWPDDVVRLRLAFALLRAGQPAAAVGPARQVLAARPDDPDALLVLGLAQRAGGSPQAAATLRRFLRLAPRHPAAPQVRRLLHPR